jgi:stress-induced morphogen
MEKLVLKNKREIRQLLEDSIKKAVHALGVTKSKKKTEKAISN